MGLPRLVPRDIVYRWQKQWGKGVNDTLDILNERKSAVDLLKIC